MKPYPTSLIAARTAVVSVLGAVCAYSTGTSGMTCALGAGTFMSACMILWFVARHVARKREMIQ